ncbi:hypothetical protein M514_08095, partial [Trichuris suis]
WKDMCAMVILIGIQSKLRSRGQCCLNDMRRICGYSAQWLKKRALPLELSWLAPEGETLKQLSLLYG